LHEEIAAIAQGVPSTKLTSFAELPSKFANLAVEVVGFNARVVQPLLSRTGVLEPFAECLDLGVGVDRYRSGRCRRLPEGLALLCRPVVGQEKQFEPRKLASILEMTHHFNSAH